MGIQIHRLLVETTIFLCSHDYRSSKAVSRLDTLDSFTLDEKFNFSLFISFICHVSLRHNSTKTPNITTTRRGITSFSRKYSIVLVALYVLFVKLIPKKCSCLSLKESIIVRCFVVFLLLHCGGYHNAKVRF